MSAAGLLRRNHPRINQADLVMVVVAGQIAHPIGRTNLYRIGHDGVPRVLPATGGIVLNQRIGDRCVGLAGDHIEPGVTLHNNQREVVGPRNGPNQALLTYACVGNRAEVIGGPCRGQQGLVTGKHGGINHILVDFPPEVLGRLQIGDRVQIRSCGLGLSLLDHPEIKVFNCSPALLKRWGLREQDGALQAPVTHAIPAAIMGSGLGKNTVWGGDYDIQLFDDSIRERYRLGSLRFGDMVAIIHGDTRFGPIYRQGRTTIGVIVHGDSTVSGHGPGVTVLLSGPAQRLRPIYDPQANLAVIFNLRSLPPARNYLPLTARRHADLPRAVAIDRHRKMIAARS
ncbi:MAG TPA: DUF4438 domain-containing protein [Candidatus Competibacter sp.]|nr:DUF4438 domain-containing protein [Candidatus Competibacter sp.]